MKPINVSSFGDLDQYPFIIRLTELLTETGNYRIYQRYMQILTDYRRTLNDLNHLDKKLRLYLYKLILFDFKGRVNDLSQKYNLEKILSSHMTCLIVSIYREKLRLMNPIM